MEEWKYTLINGAIATTGAVLVGCLALYGVLKQARKAQEGAAQQALALLQQVDRSALATRDQARWELRRGTYAETLTSCHRYLRAAREAGDLLFDQYDEDGEIIGSFNDEAQGRALGETFDLLLAQVNVLKLEGPSEALEPTISRLSDTAQLLYSTLYVWSGLVHDGRQSNYGSEYQGLLRALEETRDELLEKMYLVLHQ
ncbi:hypothetical protein TU94_15070 [Streptomyces cyaneogriseus subsp. noncyanogenus]|uniref:Uncharacterized protein n=1 Tax=Streptomyces cyaneogriseus subsp. noncyanogenus TaxID=477245 RepID=A0A0C5FY92_9ACTN|nr:hypothetical protein [Streptomyces cyaneogriseus]AJP02613.1 hypothetical protein TU94_15070 [Streptomyces cyaneogriseus subsp. noncyanogenus]